jgi:hypothetical protein
MGGFFERNFSHASFLENILHLDHPNGGVYHNYKSKGPNIEFDGDRIKMLDFEN